MQKPKYDIPVTFHSPPPFIENLMHQVRLAAERDSGMRVRMDMSAKSAISFTGKWDAQKQRDIPRRVYVETKLTDDGQISLVFMNKVFDENAVNLQYPFDKVETIQTDILQFLNVGRLPQA